jgi:hypothetical protein
MSDRESQVRDDALLGSQTWARLRSHKRVAASVRFLWNGRTVPSHEEPMALQWMLAPLGALPLSARICRFTAGFASFVQKMVVLLKDR